MNHSSASNRSRVRQYLIMLPYCESPKQSPSSKSSSVLPELPTLFLNDQSISSTDFFDTLASTSSNGEKLINSCFRCTSGSFNSGGWSLSSSVQSLPHFLMLAYFRFSLNTRQSSSGTASVWRMEILEGIPQKSKISKDAVFMTLTSSFFLVCKLSLSSFSLRCSGAQFAGKFSSIPLVSSFNTTDCSPVKPSFLGSKLKQRLKYRSRQHA